MALNLMTPRYVAPDVTKAPLAAESIRSSQASTNLAAQAQQTRDRAQQAQEQQFGAELGLRSKEQAEASAARRGNLALGWERADQGWEELGLRAEAQSVNLANTEQQMRHREDKLPFEIRGLNLANEAQDLKNEYDDATLEDQIAKVGLANKNLQADINGKKASANSITQATNFAAASQDTKLRQEANLASYQSQMNMAINMGQYDFIQGMVFEDVNPAQAQSLRAMQLQIAGREASKAALASTNRQNVNAIKQSTANQAVIDKLPTLEQQGFWRQPNVTTATGTPYTDNNAVLTPDGQAALSAQAEWLGLNLTQADTDQLMTMPVGSSTGQGWLLSGNPAGEKYLNGSMFVPTHEALQEAKALKAQQRAAEIAKYEDVSATRTTATGLKVTMKNKSVIEGEAANDKATQVIDQFKATYDVDTAAGMTAKDASTYRDETWARAMKHVGVARGQWNIFEDIQAAHRALGTGAIASGEHFYLLQDGKLRTLNAPTKQPKKKGPPTTTGVGEPDFDPLDVKNKLEGFSDSLYTTDETGASNGVYDARKVIYQDLVAGGASQRDATWMIALGINNTFRSTGAFTNDYDSAQPTHVLAEQSAGHAEHKAADRLHRLGILLGSGFDKGEDYRYEKPLYSVRGKGGYVHDLPLTEEQMRAIAKAKGKPTNKFPKIEGADPWTASFAAKAPDIAQEYLNYLAMSKRLRKVESNLKK